MAKKWILIGIMACIALGVWYRFALTAPDAEDASRVRVVIEKGSSTSDIANLLEEKSLIRSSLAFTIHARLRGEAGKLQAGTFVLQRSLGVPAIMQALQSGIVQEEAITIPEGFTVRDIDELLAERGLIQSGELEACARDCAFDAFNFLPVIDSLADRGGRVEGFLFPDTYFIDPEQFSIEAFLERLLTTFRTRVMEPYAEDMRLSGLTQHEIITLASLIEKETSTDEERPIVSGILWKRFNADMGLGVDASVRYILNKPTGPLTTADLNSPSPYNLRKFRGLPPGPIANPGIKSIEAALHPTESPYWYYLHGSDGVIRYAVTNEEHNQNKFDYLR